MLHEKWREAEEDEDRPGGQRSICEDRNHALKPVEYGPRTTANT